MKKSTRSDEVSTVAHRLRQAFVRHGLDSETPSFAREFRSIFQADIPLLTEFLNDDVDLPLGEVLRLCHLLNLPVAQVLDAGRADEHLEVFSYEGGAAAHVILPPGLMWDRSHAESLFYWFVENSLTSGLRPGEMLVATRLTVKPEPGVLYLIEDDQEVRPMYCRAVDERGMVGFSRDPDSSTPELVMPEAKGLGITAQGMAAITGRVLWRLCTMDNTTRPSRA